MAYTLHAQPLNSPWTLLLMNMKVVLCAVRNSKSCAKNCLGSNPFRRVGREVKMNHVSEQIHVIRTLCQQVVRIALIKKPCNYQDHSVRDRHSTRFRPIDNIATITKRRNIRQMKSLYSKERSMYQNRSYIVARRHCIPSWSRSELHSSLQRMTRIFKFPIINFPRPLSVAEHWTLSGAR